jgi:hypothetical protein
MGFTKVARSHVEETLTTPSVRRKRDKNAPSFRGAKDPGGMMMKKEKSAVFRLLTLLLLSFCTPTGAFAGQTIIGTGNPSDDIRALRNAVDRGGKIILKGTFDLGHSEWNTVGITKDVRIIGEIHDGQPPTIMHGAPAFLIGVSHDWGGWFPDVSVSIKGIHFVDSFGMGIAGVVHRDLAIKDCTFSNVFPDGMYGHGQAAIRTNLFWVPMLQTGRISIENNVIDLNPHGIVPAVGMAMDIPLLEGADILVSGNTVKNFNLRGIEILDVQGKAVLRNNVFTASDGSIYSNVAGNIPIVLYNGAVLPYSVLESTVVNNNVYQNDVFGFGIAVVNDPQLSAPVTPRPVIKDNTIAMNNSADTFFISPAVNASRGWGLCLRNLQGGIVKGNTIKGKSNIGIGVSLMRAEALENLDMRDNDLSGFSSSECVESDYVAPIFDGSGNMIDSGTPPVQCGVIRLDL